MMPRKVIMPVKETGSVIIIVRGRTHQACTREDSPGVGQTLSRADVDAIRMHLRNRRQGL